MTFQACSEGAVWKLNEKYISLLSQSAMRAGDYLEAEEKILAAFLSLTDWFCSRQQGLTLFGLGVAWLICNALAIFLCM